MRTAGILASAAVLIGVCLFFADEAGSWALSGFLKKEVTVEHLRMAGPTAFSAAAVTIGSPQSPEFIFRQVEVSHLAHYLSGGKIRVTAGSIQAGKEVFERAVLRAKRGNVFFFWADLPSKNGRVRGGFVWRAGLLKKAHGQVVLSDKGLHRLPKQLAGRLRPALGGHAFLATYVTGRIVFRGSGGPFLEAAWKPA